MGGTSEKRRTHKLGSSFFVLYFFWSLWGTANILTIIYAKPSDVPGLAFFLTLSPIVRYTARTTDHSPSCCFSGRNELRDVFCLKLNLYSPRKLMCSHPRGKCDLAVLPEAYLAFCGVQLPAGDRRYSKR